MSTQFFELVIDGPHGWDLGFVRGFLNGRGEGGKVFNAEKEGFDCESLREDITELLKGSDIAHLLVPENLVETVREAVEASGKAGYPMTIRHERKIAKARFKCTFHAYSKETGEKIKEIFDREKLDKELVVEFDFKERTDPGAEGVELYAPTHDYEMTGEASAEGPIKPFVELYRKCRAEDLIKTSKAELIA